VDLGRSLLFFLFIAILVHGVHAATEITSTAPGPVVFLNFNEGSGDYAFDISGHGSAGIIHNASRIVSGCGKALSFNGIDSYVGIPISSTNHPVDAITVSAWFYTDAFEPATLVSTYDEGGYRLGFDDGDDLWWTVNVVGTGDVSVPVQHEGITLHQWHQVTGTFDGKTSKIYLDGILINEVNASGQIHYQYNNSIILGAEAGAATGPAESCPRYFQGGLDDLRIYDSALSYVQVMDDRFSCPQELSPPPAAIQEQPAASCGSISGSLQLGSGDSALKTISFTNATDNASWNVSLPPGSTLIVQAKAAYAKLYPNAWYLGISDAQGWVDRAIAFPNTNNAPVEGIIPSGNATVTVRYFDGPQRFPAQVTLQFNSVLPPQKPIIPQIIQINPIIVIYSASWATFIALIFVGVWLHRRRKNADAQQENENSKEK
jgi:hypothetical protein